MAKAARLSPLTIVFMIVFFDLLGFGILIPVIPQLLANPLSPEFLLPSSMNINQGLILLGFLTASYPLGQFFANPILGELSDRLGRRKILAICLFGTAVSYLVFAYAIIIKSLWLLFASRLVDGITGGNIAVAQAAIADSTKPEERARSFGLIGAAFGLGFILGPYIGGKLSDPSLVSWFSAATPFWFAAALGFINWILVLLYLPETLKHKSEEKSLHIFKSVQNLVKAFKLPNLNVLFGTAFLFGAGFTFYTSFASVYLTQRFGFTQGNTGDFFSYIGIWIALTQAVLTGILAKRFKEFQILRWSIPLVGILIGVYYLPHQWQWLLLIVPFFAMAVGLTNANMTSLVSRSASGKIQGEVLGISSSVQAFAQVIPAALSGYIASSISPETPLLVGAGVILLAAIFFVALYRPQQVATPEPSPA